MNQKLLKVAPIKTETSSYTDQSFGYLQFENFCLENVLKTGVPLVACKSEEFDDSDDERDLMTSEDYISRVAKRKS